MADDLILVCCILDYGLGSQALSLAKECGAVGETIVLGKGTVTEKWLKILGALEIRKEILLAVIAKNGEDAIYKALAEQFNLEKPQRGIAFSLPLGGYFPFGRMKSQEAWRKEKGGKKVAYEAIFIVVNKGLSADVIDAAESAGSTGGTLIHGRGSGTKEKAKLFNIEIEPEKDIVLILAKRERTEAIVGAIEAKLGISKPGAGIVFVTAVTKTLGLYEG